MAIERKWTIQEKAKNVVSAGLVAAGMFAGGSWGINRFADNRVYADQGEGNVSAVMKCEDDEARLEVGGGVPTESGLTQTSYGVPDEVTLIFNSDGYTKTEVMRNSYFVECFDSEHPLWERPFTVSVLEPRVFVNQVTGRVVACLEEFTSKGVSCLREFGPLGALDGVDTAVNWYDVPHDFPTPTPSVTATPTPTATPEFTPTPTFTPTPEPTATATATPAFCDARIEIDGYVEGEVEGQGISAVAGFEVVPQIEPEGVFGIYKLDDQGDVSFDVPNVPINGERAVTLFFFPVNERFLDEPFLEIEVRCDQTTRVSVGFDARDGVGGQTQRNLFIPFIQK